MNDNKITGITILKNISEEKKICSLFIHPDYRGESWIYSIFMDSLTILKTQKPVITIPEPIIKGRYNKNYKEHGFNEKL